MRKYSLLLAILLILTSPIAAVADEPAGGVINGVISNGTAGGSDLSGANITLFPYVDNVPGEALSTAVGSDGSFRFEGLDTAADCLLIFTHTEVDYYFQVGFEDGETETTVDLLVFDASYDPLINIVLAHAIVYIEEDYLSVSQVMWLVNDSDRTYLGTGNAGEGTLVFTLPPGASGFEAPMEMSGDYFFLDDGRISFDMPLPPGERQLVYHYQLPLSSSGKNEILFSIDYPADEFHLLIEGEERNINAPRLSPGEPVVTTEGESFAYYEGGPFLPGETIEVDIAGSGLNNQILTIIIGAVIVVGIGIAAYVFNRKKTRREGDKPHSKGDATAGSKRSGEVISQIEDDFRQGVISEEMYRQLISEKTSRPKESERGKTGDGAADA